MRLLKGYKPLVFEDDRIIIVSKKSKVYRYDIQKRRIDFLVEIPTSLKRRILSFSRLAFRVSRGGIKNAVILDSVFYCTYESQVWKLDLAYPHAEITPIFRFPRGNSSLNFTVIDDIISNQIGFDKGIYFGEYFSNPDMQEVSIYKISASDAVVPVFTFPVKTVNHIHNIVVDTDRACVWVLTGDFEDGAAIWKMEDCFNKVTCVCKGEQKFRSCIAFPTKKGLLYATDSQFIQNEIRLLTESSDFAESIILHNINGPSIFGTEIRGNYIFTTATEPISGIKITWRELFNTKPGPCIRENRSEVYLVTPDLEMHSLFTNYKDRWPYYIAQFGNILLPSGENKSGCLITYSVANKVNDLSTEIRTWDEIKEMIKN